MKTYGFGIVGCGLVSECHVQSVQSLPNARLIGVGDKFPEAAKRMAARFDCPAFPSVQELISRRDVDVVCVCTPSGTHAEVSIEAARAGKHVLVEKPLDITLERTDRIIQACADAGVSLGGIFPSRFVRCNQLAKQAIAQGRIGNPTLGSAYVKWFRSQDYYDRGGWRGTWALDGGGALMNQSIHAIDLLQWFMGDVESVQAFTATLGHTKIEVEDTGAACLRFKNGALGVIEGSTAAFPGFFKRVEVSGTRGTVIVEEETVKTWRFEEETEEDERIRQELGAATQSGGGASDPGAIRFENHRAQIEEFLQALEGKRRPLVDGVEARKAVAIILAIYQSAREGKTIPLQT